jgi:hypothetical protein
VFADVFNISNQGTPIVIFGANGPFTFGRVLARTDSRMLRLAVRVEF